MVIMVVLRIHNHSSWFWYMTMVLIVVVQKKSNNRPKSCHWIVSCFMKTACCIRGFEITRIGSSLVFHSTRISLFSGSETTLKLKPKVLYQLKWPHNTGWYVKWYIDNVCYWGWEPVFPQL
jgi:hypothetical protein